MLLHSHSKNTETWSGQSSALRGMGEAFWRLPWTLLQPLLWGPSRGKVMSILRSEFSSFLVSVSLTSQSATFYPHSPHNSCCAFSHFPYMKKKKRTTEPLPDKNLIRLLSSFPEASSLCVVLWAGVDVNEDDVWVWTMVDGWAVLEVQAKGREQEGLSMEMLFWELPWDPEKRSGLEIPSCGCWHSQTSHVANHPQI